MIKRSAILALAGTLLAGPAVADDQTWDAALGGGIGGAAGAAVGNEIGGREGAMIGGALGAAGGAAVTTDERHEYRDDRRRYRDEGRRYRGRGGFCPPGLAKQGRC